MLRKTPFNFLATLTIAAVLWIATGLFLGNYLSDNVSLQQMTIDEFLVIYRGTTIVGSVLGLLITWYWLMRGGAKAAATNPVASRKRWVGLAFAQVLVATAAVIVFVALTMAESLTIGNYSLILGGMLLCTAVFFWITTLVMSPIHVMVTVPGYR